MYICAFALQIFWFSTKMLNIKHLKNACFPVKMHPDTRKLLIMISRKKNSWNWRVQKNKGRKTVKKQPLSLAESCDERSLTHSPSQKWAFSRAKKGGAREVQIRGGKGRPLLLTFPCQKKRMTFEHAILILCDSN